MNLKGLDLNLLVALDVLLRERSITRGGERLGLSQSAMSGALARLRDYFSDPLLVPVGRSLMLTPLAEGLADPVGRILHEIQNAISTRARFDPEQSDRRFSIMASDYAFTAFMPQLFARLEREAPGVSLQLRQLSPNWHEDLNRGHVDFLIVPERYALPNHPSLPIFEDDFRCVAWSGNKSIGRTLSLEQYLSAGHVVVELSGVQEASFDEWFLRSQGHVRRVEIVAPTFALVPQLVVGTRRVATIWSRLAEMATAHLPLKQLPLPVEIPSFKEVLQWPVQRDTEPGNVWLRRILRETASQSLIPKP
jgi:LysR family transcriptional regulator, nod-box dependent transcriptional activator